MNDGRKKSIGKKEYATVAAALRAYASGAPKPGEIEDDPILGAGQIESLISKFKGYVWEKKEDLKAALAAHQKSYDERAKAQMAKHSSQQTYRESLEAAREGTAAQKSDIQPGNPGPGQSSTATEKAKELDPNAGKNVGVAPGGTTPVPVSPK